MSCFSHIQLFYTLSLLSLKSLSSNHLSIISFRVCICICVTNCVSVCLSVSSGSYIHLFLYCLSLLSLKSRLSISQCMSIISFPLCNVVIKSTAEVQLILSFPAPANQLMATWLAGWLLQVTYNTDSSNVNQTGIFRHFRRSQQIISTTIT